LVNHRRSCLYCLFTQHSSDTIRSDAQGRIWKLINGSEIIWLDLTKDSGTVYTLPAFGNYMVNVSVRRNLTVHTWKGDFSNCFGYLFDVPQIIDEEIEYILAPGVGPIKIRGGWRDDLLYSAVIGGKVVSVPGGQEDPVREFSLSQNYPNPFNALTRIYYTLPGQGHVTLRVFKYWGKKFSLS
jgi:hypothetical protein